MNINNNQYRDLDDVQEKGKMALFFENIGKSITQNRLVSVLRRKILLRKTLTMLLILAPIILLIVDGINSPTRITYSKEQLASEHDFENKTGTIKLVNQTYSSKNGIMVFEFETNDYTTSISKGINADNLEWEFFTPPEADTSNTLMEVIPLTGNKIDVVVKNVPKNYGVMVVRVKNTTTPEKEEDVSVQKYEDYKEAEKEKSSEAKEETENADQVDFYITPQNGKLKNGKLENLSRENFTLQVFEEELSFQKKEYKRLKTVIENLTKGIKEDQKTLEQLQREAQYLVGSQLEENQEEVKDIQDEITLKERNINTAEDNINSLDAIIENLKARIKEVKDGTYKFNSPVRSVKKDI